MPNQVPGPVRKERTHRMIALGKELSLAFHRRYEGQTRPVLWETNTGADKNGLRWAGYTDNYIRVNGSGSADLFNKVTPTRLSDARPDGISGTVR
jgi:threonylcarbamoyladenosine tRNA methylthiotransferase MtaB